MLRFGTSGIRGVFNRELTLGEVHRLCYSLSQNFSGTFCFGYDTRRSSQVLAYSLAAGLSYYGKEVVVFGILPTPALAFLTKEGGFGAGLMLTASHNPPKYVGIKVFDNEGTEIDHGKEKDIEDSLNRYVAGWEATRRGGIRLDRTGAYTYLSKILSILPKSDQPLKILLDFGNGAALGFTDRVLRELGHQVITLNGHPCSCSLSRILEPTANTLKETAILVRTLKVDLGIAHDGDGDRTVLIDNQGNVLEDQTFSLLALLTVTKKGIVVISINTSQSVEQLAEKMGFRILRTQLGKTFLLMKKERGVLATEPSKVTDASWGNWEDGIYIAVKIVQYITASKRRISEVIRRLPKNHYYQQNMSLEHIDKKHLEEKILIKYKKEIVERLDGWKIRFSDGSFLLFRISGTERKIRVYVDSATKQRADELLRDGIKLVKNLR